MKDGSLRWLWKMVAALAILLILIHAPEFTFLVDAAYLDVFAILLASTALGRLASLRNGLLFVGAVFAHVRAGLQASLLARPHGFAVSAGFAVATLVLLPGCLHVLPLFGLPALFPATGLG